MAGTPWTVPLGLKKVGKVGLDRTSQSFYKSVEFSPSGTTLLTTSEDNLVLLEPVDISLVDQKTFYKGGSSGLSSQPLKVNTGESINSAIWHPTSQYFATSCKDHPIHLRSATTGLLECSFVGKNCMDELETATALSFNLQGTHIYSGAKSTIRVFDLERPGEPVQEFITKNSSGRGGGLISALAFCPDYSGAYAAGSYSNRITVFVENGTGPALEISDLDFAITCLRWSPDGQFLWSGGRNSDDLICFDLRHTRRELGRVTRCCKSQQKYSFALDPWGSLLLTGSQLGELYIYNAKNFELLHKEDRACADASHSVAMHPYAALVAVAQGQRVFHQDETENEKQPLIPSDLTLWEVPYSQLSIPENLELKT